MRINAVKPGATHSELALRLFKKALVEKFPTGLYSADEIAAGLGISKSSARLYLLELVASGDVWTTSASRGVTKRANLFSVEPVENKSPIELWVDELGDEAFKLRDIYRGGGERQKYYYRARRAVDMGLLERVGPGTYKRRKK